MSAPVSCDLCGGPANWTVIEGEIWFSCKLRCDGFMQIEMFQETEQIPKWNLSRDGEYTPLRERDSDPAWPRPDLPF